MWGTLAQRIMYNNKIFTLLYLYKKILQKLQKHLKNQEKPMLMDKMEETMSVNT